jgi:hypothetical protein
MTETTSPSMTNAPMTNPLMTRDQVVERGSICHSASWSPLTTVLLGVVIVVGVGCGRSESEPQAAKSPPAQPPAEPIDPSTLVQASADSNSGLAPKSQDQVDDELAEAMFGGDDADPAPPIEPIPVTPENSVNLRTDLPAERLVEFLKLADLEMQNVASGKAGIFDQRTANEEMIRLGKLKLQAATQLEAASSNDPNQKSLAIRGQLQSLSHLAALGDVKAAEQLETLANQQVANEDLTVAEDSRLVLIGLALEKIQNGTAKDSSEVMRQVEGLGDDGRTPNIAAMMVLGQARAVLEKYGYTAESSLVRNRIVDLFADHPDPNVSAMAHDIAGTPRFAEVDQLIRDLAKGDDAVTVSAWRDAIKGLLSESPDLTGVQFAAGAALQAEAAGRNDLTSATYEELSAAEGLGEAEQQEIELAIAARDARQASVGKPVDFDLPSTDGRPLTMSSYAGRVVLMPFWAIAFPESLAVLQPLDEIRSSHPGKVEILGVNLDGADAPVDKFMAQSPVRFRSFKSESASGAGSVNELASRFGVVSMPFVLVIGTDGNVAAIDFTGQNAKSIVDELLAE